MANNFDAVGIERTVNATTINNSENDPDIAATTDGRFFVVFEREFTPGVDIDIRGQFVNANGTLSGGQISIDNGGGFQINPAVATRVGGGSTVVYLNSASSDEVHFLTVTNAGVVGTEQDVLTGNPYVNSPDLAQLADGRVLVVAQQNNATQDIVFNFINAAATGTTGATFLDNGAGDQINPVAAAFGNNALVTYIDDAAGNGDVVARFFNGTAFGAEFTIANAAQALNSPDVAALTDGRFVVVWSNDDTDDLSARFVSATGAPLGAVFNIANGGGDQDNPRVAALPDGGFIVTYQDNSGTIAPDNIGGPDNAIHARRFDANGNPAGDEFLVNTSTTNDQTNSAVAVNLSNGTAYVAWDDFGTHVAPEDDDPSGVRGLAFITATDVVNGTAGDDSFQTYGLSETIHGLAGNDVIGAGAGDDNVTGDAGDDTLFGGTGNDTVSGGDGDDVVNGGSGNDNITGDAGNDALLGGAGADTIDGGAGNDGINGQDGNDNLTGGAGSDNIFGGDGADFLDGGADSDIVRAEDGNDTVHGGDAFDIVQGDAGDDQVFGDGGADLISGGLGNDLVDGGDGDDFVFGEQGNDTVIGGNGDDRVFGGTEDDLLFGNDGNDLLVGQAGNDTLDGGAGNDTLVGEGFVDTYVFGPGMGNDTIVDFGFVYGPYNPDGSVNIITAGGANNEDHINVASTLAPNFAFIQSHASQVAGPGGFPQVVIDFGGGNSLTLLNFHLTDLTASDFTFT